MLSGTAIKKFFSDLKLDQRLEVYRHLLQKLRAFGYMQGRIVALDSMSIEVYCRSPTKRGALAKLIEVSPLVYDIYTFFFQSL